MSINKIDLKTILIITLIVVILFLRFCEGDGEVEKGTIDIDGKKYEVVKHTVDTVVVPVKETIYKEGKTIFVEDTVYVDTPTNVDTSVILRDYFSKVVYKDTIRLKDSLGFITIKDTITKNSILNRTFESNVNKFFVKETLVVKDPPKYMFFLGGTAGFDKTNIVNFVGPTFIVKDKKDKMYSFAVGYGLNKSVSLQGGMLWNISFKKPKK